MTREMEQEPDMENVVFIDEYPELKKMVWLRRLHTQRQMGRLSIADGPADILLFPGEEHEDGGPDGAA